MKTIAYVGGCGRLGLALACWSAEMGYNVVCADVSAEAVAAIESGKSPRPGYEPRVDELVERWAGKRLFATTDTEPAVIASDLVFMLVPTPSDESGAFSLEYMLPACEEVAGGLAMRELMSTVKPTVIVVSTVMPGQTEGELLPVLMKKTDWFGLCYSPEFIRQGSIIKDFSTPDVVLIGANDGGSAAEEYYRNVVLNEPLFHHISIVSAEIAKIGLNAAVVTKLAVANQLAWLCHNTPGADAQDVLGAIGGDSRIGNKFFGAGTWPGGPCFPRDTRALAVAGKQALTYTDMPIAEAVSDFGHTQLCRLGDLCERLMEYFPRLGILGLSYKPGTPITEESQGLALFELLKGYDVRGHDPVATNADLREVVDSSDLLVLMTPWPEYKKLEEMDLGGKCVLDMWGFLDEGKLNCSYVRFGEGE